MTELESLRKVLDLMDIDYGESDGADVDPPTFEFDKENPMHTVHEISICTGPIEFIFSKKDKKFVRMQGIHVSHIFPRGMDYDQCLRKCNSPEVNTIIDKIIEERENKEDKNTEEEIEEKLEEEIECDYVDFVYCPRCGMEKGCAHIDNESRECIDEDCPLLNLKENENEI